MLTKEQLREAGLMKAELTPTGICVVTDNGTEIFLTNETMKRFGEAMERRDKHEYEVIRRVSQTRTDVLTSFWAKDAKDAIRVLEGLVRQSDRYYGQDIDVRLKSK